MKKLFDQKFYETFLSEFKDLNSEYASIIERGSTINEANNNIPLKINE